METLLAYDEVSMEDWRRRGENIVFVHGLPVMAAVALWTLVYKLSGLFLGLVLKDGKKMAPSQTFRARSRVVSFIFSTTVLAQALHGLFFDENLKGDSMTAYSPTAYLAIVNAVGYFLWDIVICLCHYADFKFGFLFHAVACFLTFVSFLVRVLHSFSACVSNVHAQHLQDGKFLFYGCFYLTFEASTPFLNLHWMFEKLGYDNSHPLKAINGVLLVIAFFTSRILCGIGYSTVVWQDLDQRFPSMVDASDRHFVYYYKFAMVSLSILNLYWFFLLARGLITNIVSPKMQRRKKAD